MRKLVYISDFLMEQIQKITLSCGAEIYDHILLGELENQDCKVLIFGIYILLLRASLRRTQIVFV